MNAAAMAGGVRAARWVLEACRKQGMLSILVLAQEMEEDLAIVCTALTEMTAATESQAKAKMQAMQAILRLREVAKTLRGA